MVEIFLFWAVVLLLVLVTGGVIYLTLADWRDRQRAKDQERRR
ncbi:hypothetical protein [Candidatus Cyanaurora vandensis]|nr:hypothetical protein [Candidatus Cyanaurora vandensis]